MLYVVQYSCIKFTYYINDQILETSLNSKEWIARRKIALKILNLILRGESVHQPSLFVIILVKS